MEAKYQKILDLLMAQTGLNQETVKSLMQTDEPDSSGEDSAEDVDASSDGQGQWVLGEYGLWHNENLE